MSIVGDISAYELCFGNPDEVLKKVDAMPTSKGYPNVDTRTIDIMEDLIHMAELSLLEVQNRNKLHFNEREETYKKKRMSKAKIKDALAELKVGFMKYEGLLEDKINRAKRHLASLKYENTDYHRISVMTRRTTYPMR